MGIKEFFSNRAETTDKHTIPELRTRYYKVNKQKAMEAVRYMINQEERFKLLDYSESLGEVTVEILSPRRAFMVLSVITVFPFRTAIDFTITTSTLLLPIDLGYSKKQVISFYKKLDKQLEFAGVSLNKED